MGVPPTDRSDTWYWTWLRPTRRTPGHRRVGCGPVFRGSSTEISRPTSKPTSDPILRRLC